MNEHDSRWTKPFFLVGLAVYIGAIWTLPKCVPNPPPQAYAVEEVPPEVWATDGVENPARPMPGKPFEGQKKPPCAPDEFEAKGGCWVELARKPGADRCGSKSYEQGGKCYLPVLQLPRPPTSIEP